MMMGGPGEPSPVRGRVTRTKHVTRLLTQLGSPVVKSLLNREHGHTLLAVKL